MKQLLIVPPPLVDTGAFISTTDLLQKQLLARELLQRRPEVAFDLDTYGYGISVPYRENETHWLSRCDGHLAPPFGVYDPRFLEISFEAGIRNDMLVERARYRLRLRCHTLVPDLYALTTGLTSSPLRLYNRGFLQTEAQTIVWLGQHAPEFTPYQMRQQAAYGEGQKSEHYSPPGLTARLPDYLRKQQV